MPEAHAILSTCLADIRGLDAVPVATAVESLSPLPPTAEPVKPDETRGVGQLCAGGSFGGLIQAGPGRSGGVGRFRTKRSGWAA